MNNATAWLAIAAGDNREHAGNRGYEDDPSSYYSWDSTVPNHAAPKEGDVIALWDKETLLGASVIDRIEEGEATKERLRCPECGSTNIKTRSRGAVRYRCASGRCREEFNSPRSESVDVHTYRSRHEAAWVDLEGCLDGETLRHLCLQPRSQHSIRELDWDSFRERIGEKQSLASLGVISDTRGRLAGGHRKRIVRARVGQGRFRARMLRDFGSVCALTGPQPSTALEAAHLYSYSRFGTHHREGGLLLRRDVHSLFDLGLICVRPGNLSIDVHPDLADFPEYADMEGRPVRVRLSAGAEGWIRRHWEQHRGTSRI